MKIGDKVRLRDLDGFIAEIRRKCGGGRVGDVVRGSSWDTQNRVIVTFPAIGRKKEFTATFHVRGLDLVTDPPHGKEGV